MVSKFQAKCCTTESKVISMLKQFYHTEFWWGTYKMSSHTLLCLIIGVRERSNKMHPGENYQDFWKWGGGEVFLGHSVTTIKGSWGGFPQNLQFDTALQLAAKDYNIQDLTHCRDTVVSRDTVEIQWYLELFTTS